MKLTPYGAVGRIGGSMFGLELDDVQIMLDVGIHFGSDFEYGFIRPNAGAGLADQFITGGAPKVPGFWSEKALSYYTNVIRKRDIRYEPPRYDRILVSHVHGDHIYMARYTDPNIPVAMSPTGLSVLSSLTTTSRWFGPLRNTWTVPFPRRFDIEGTAVTAFPVNHSVPGAVSLLIESDTTVLYTGDLRDGPQTRAMLGAVAKAGVDTLLTEGTRVGQNGDDRTEETVEREVLAIVKDHKDRLVLETHAPRDIERAWTVYKIALLTGRRYVMTPRLFHLLRTLRDDGLLPYPFDLSSVGLYWPEAVRPSKWVQEVLDSASQQIITHREIRRSQGSFVVELDDHRLFRLADFNPKSGAAYIWSKHEFADDEEQMRREVVQNHLNLYGIRRYVAHASGHLSEMQVARMVRRLAPKVVIPVHTEHPEKFRQFADAKVVLPKVGWGIRLD